MIRLWHYWCKAMGSKAYDNDRKDDHVHNIIRTFGEDNVLLGTDYPFPLGESNPRKFFKEVNLPKNVELKIKKENLLKIL